MPRRPSIKTQPMVSEGRAASWLRTRYNSIRGLTPEMLSTQLDSFEAGYLSSAALTWAQIQKRDDMLRSVVPKREKAIARRAWDVLAIDDSPEAQRHKETLDEFYNNVTVIDAVNENRRGGFPLLVRQMMSATGAGFAVHEIVWEPGEPFTATFRFTPLWWFENTTGRLRYLETAGATAGVDLEPGGWLTTCTDGLMPASAVAYMYKHLPLKDWLIYCERHGMPGVKGKTAAKRGSTEWNDMVDAVTNFATDYAVVMSHDEDIEALNIEARGALPYAPLVDRMDRAMSAMWRGADLSTLSSKSVDAIGASVQADESKILEADDAGLIAETLNEQVDRWVIRYVHGADRALAYVTFPDDEPEDVDSQIKVDSFFIQSGIPLGVDDVYERYGRARPGDDEEVVRAVRPDRTDRTERSDAARLANRAPMRAVAAREQGAAVERALLATATAEIDQAEAEDLAPVRRRLDHVLGIDDPQFLTAGLVNLRADLPALLREINGNPKAARALDHSFAAALVNGWAEGAARGGGARGSDGLDGSVRSVGGET